MGQTTRRTVAGKQAKMNLLTGRPKCLLAAQPLYQEPSQLERFGA